VVAGASAGAEEVGRPEAEVPATDGVPDGITGSDTVGAALPGVPLWVRGFGFVPLDLESSYTEACRRSRLT